MKSVEVLVLVACCMWHYTSEAIAEIVIYGSNTSLTRSACGLTTYLGSDLRQGQAIGCKQTDGRMGQWIACVENAGMYTAAIEETYGFGPVVRTGITVTEDGSNRATITLPFSYDLLDWGGLSEQAHQSFAQTFVAAGTAITAVAFVDSQDVRVSLHEQDPDGAQIGPVVRASHYYPVDQLPTEPGKQYCLRFDRADGQPFRMQVVEQNRYHDGLAFVGGGRQSSIDLALRIQHNPVGQILRHQPGMASVFGQGVQSYGQTFVARGTSVALLSVFPATGASPDAEVTIRLREEGPDGREVMPPIVGRLVVFNPDVVGLVPGKRYFIEVCRAGSAEALRMWASKEDEFPGGHLHLDGEAVPERDLAMVFVEHGPDTQAPSPPIAVSYSAGTPPYAQRLPFDHGVRIVWDLPGDGDISNVVVRRAVIGSDGPEGDRIVATIPAPAKGRYQFTDRGLDNEPPYRYTINTVDLSGNESTPLQAPVRLIPGAVLASDLLNGDFTGPNDSDLPYGWTPKTIGGAVPAFRMGWSDGRNAIPSAGWEVSEGAGWSDTVLYQVVPCDKGHRYRLSADVRLWNPWNNREMVICAMVGIDPAGGTDPLAESVVWGAPTHRREEWVSLVVWAEAHSDQVTVYLRGNAQYTRLMNTRFRDARLTDVTLGQ